MSRPGESIRVAALYVQPGGAYWDLPDVDPWDEARDARLYAGPWPVVAHPPCARWCRLAQLVQHNGGAAVGDDRGCFEAALRAVRHYGGVLEHPAWSIAWGRFGLMAPPSRGWSRMMSGEWVCEVAQSAYGHRARKLSWLLYVGPGLPPHLDWRKPRGTHVVTRVAKDCRELIEMTKAERSATPPAFRDVLLDLARSARPGESAQRGSG